MVKDFEDNISNQSYTPRISARTDVETDHGTPYNERLLATQYQFSTTGYDKDERWDEPDHPKYDLLIKIMVNLVLTLILFVDFQVVEFVVKQKLVGMITTCRCTEKMLQIDEPAYVHQQKLSIF